MPNISLSQEAYDRLNDYRQTDKGEVSFSQAVISLVDTYEAEEERRKARRAQ